MHSTNLLDAFGKFRKATISFVLSVPQSIHPSIRSYAAGDHPLKGFS